MGEWKEYKFSDLVNINSLVKLLKGEQYSFVEMKDLTDGQRHCFPSVITDRNDLDDQLFETFAASKQLLRQEPVQAKDREDLKGLLKVASGGVGTLEHIYEGLVEGKADAALAASIFHYREYTIKEAKEYLKARGVPVRL